MTEAGIVIIVAVVIVSAFLIWEQWTLLRPWRIKRDNHEISLRDWWG